MYKIALLSMCLLAFSEYQQSEDEALATLLLAGAPAIRGSHLGDAACRSADPVMKKICTMTGKKANRKAFIVTFSHKRNHKVQEVNLQMKRFWWPEQQKTVRMKVATSTMRTIRKNGLDATAKK